MRTSILDPCWSWLESACLKFWTNKTLQTVLTQLARIVKKLVWNLLWVTYRVGCIWKLFDVIFHCRFLLILIKPFWILNKILFVDRIHMSQGCKATLSRQVTLTTKSPEVHVTHLINLGRIKSWVEHETMLTVDSLTFLHATLGLGKSKNLHTIFNQPKIYCTFCSLIEFSFTNIRC